MPPRKEESAVRIGSSRLGGWLARPSRWVGGAFRRMAGLRRRRLLAVAALLALGLGGGLGGSRVWLARRSPGLVGPLAVTPQAAVSLPGSYERQGPGGAAFGRFAGTPSSDPRTVRGEAVAAGDGARPEGGGPLQAVGSPAGSGGAGPSTAARGAAGSGLAGEGFVPGRDAMRWPADGLLVSTAGWRRHPVRGDWSYQPGLELAVLSGAAVRAAAAGTVSEVAAGADGYTVIVDHGGGWTTVYGRLSEVRVRTGQPVSPGTLLGRAPAIPDAVAAMAGTASAQKPAPGSWVAWEVGRSTVTFEVRRGGESVDPLRVLGPGWLRVAPDTPNSVSGGEDGGPDGAAGVSGYPVPGP